MQSIQESMQEGLQSRQEHTQTRKDPLKIYAQKAARNKAKKFESNVDNNYPKK